MAALSQPVASFSLANDAHVQPIGVYDLFRNHLHAFARLPGEVSNFEQCGPGYQWHCEFDLGRALAGGAVPMCLHFFLFDTVGKSRPVAALYLMVGYPTGEQRSHLLNLTDLTETLDDLNRALAEGGGIVEMSERANHFVEELAEVKDELGSEVIWE